MSFWSMAFRKLQLTGRNRSHEESRANSCVHWPSIDSDIEEIVRKCRQCQEPAKQPQKQPLKPWPTTTQVFERVHIDLAGPCSDSNSYLVIVDSFSRWPEVFMLRHTSSQYVIEQLQWLFDWFGIPKTLVSDNGPQFTSSHFKDFCDINGFVTSFHHHTTHNQTEQPKKEQITVHAPQIERNVTPTSPAGRNHDQLEQNEEQERNQQQTPVLRRS
ncbi:hypothetical protein niasHT_033207 [Heterodera trifolii]|uniref:RNA-directed DNA polymerase n=1 Tax=Heterodera trifolii TaxID=157864 RepID=A0ABD2HWP7_9BILA